MVQGRQDGPMVLPRAFALLRLLSEEPGGLTLSAIAVALDVPKSSLSSTLKALVDQGFLARTGQLYSLGSEAYALASTILAGRSLRQIARPVLEMIAEETGETVLFAVPDSSGQNATYIDFVESPQSVRFAVEIGTSRPLYASACGLVFLAYVPAKELSAYLENAALVKRTETTVTNPAKIKKRLSEIRANGIAETRGDYSPDSAGFAAPVYNAEGDAIAALNIGVPVTRGERDAARLRAAAKKGAAEISRILGYRNEN